jgi:hypothetical protein
MITPLKAKKYRISIYIFFLSTVRKKIDKKLNPYIITQTRINTFPNQSYQNKKILKIKNLYG